VRSSVSGAFFAGLMLTSIGACSGSTGHGQPATALSGSTAENRTGSSSSRRPLKWQATLKDNHHTVTVSVDDTIILKPSTFWTIRPLAHTSPLVQNAGPTTTQTNTPCIPGGGCGTTTAQYHAVRPGRVSLTADRTLCGEARRCTGGEATYLLTIVVG